MNLLVTAATALEIKPFQEYLAQNGAPENCQVDILTGGIGLMHTAWHLGRELARKSPTWPYKPG
jgi:futalosine hydrolase